MRNIKTWKLTLLGFVATLLGAAAWAQIGGGGITGGGGGVSPDTGNFTVQWNSGFTVTQNQVVNYSKLGNLVTLRFTADVTGTSNSIGFTNNGTNGVPATYRPTVDVTFWGLACTDNGAVISCCMVIHAATGGIDMSPAITANIDRCSASFNAAGTKGMQTGATRVNQVTYSTI